MTTEKIGGRTIELGPSSFKEVSGRRVTARRSLGGVLLFFPFVAIDLNSSITPDLSSLFRFFLTLLSESGGNSAIADCTLQRMGLVHARG